MKHSNNTELIVRALENGTVIDHIPANKLFKIVSLLHLEKLDNHITIGNNLMSKKLGRKGMIKLSDTFLKPQEINKITLIAPMARVSIIKNYEVDKKINLKMPNEVSDIFKCINPMCITNKEGIPTRFHIVNKKEGKVKCHYCERTINSKDLILR